MRMALLVHGSLGPEHETTLTLAQGVQSLSQGAAWRTVPSSPPQLPLPKLANEQIS